MDHLVNLTVFDAFGIKRSYLTHEQVVAADILSVTFEKAQSKSLDQDADWGLPTIPPELADFEYHFMSPEDAFDLLAARWVELGLPL
jgi:hypothetical protein